MAELTTLARPYAKAAFEYAKEKNAINDWESFLLLAANVVSSEAFVDLLHNPAISAEQKTGILVGVCHPSSAPSSPIKQVLDTVQLPEGMDIDALVQKVAPNVSVSEGFGNFIAQLAEYDRLVLLPEIYQLYVKLKSQELKQVDAYVTSAYPLTDEQRKMLQKSLAEREQAIVILHETVNPDLMAGATIKIGDRFTDSSVRGKLKQLKTQLIS